MRAPIERDAPFLKFLNELQRLAGVPLEQAVHVLLDLGQRAGS